MLNNKVGDLAAAITFVNHLEVFGASDVNNVLVGDQPTLRTD